MIKNLLVLCVITATSLSALALPNETILLQRTYKLKVSHGALECRNGIPPNGHNYPVPTTITFELGTYNLWGSDIWTNVDHYIFDADYLPCSTYSNILKPVQGQELIGTVTQKITESHNLNGFGKCMRATREEAILVVGGVTLNGVNEFIVGPVNAAYCKQ